MEANSRRKFAGGVERPHGNTVVWRYMGLDKFLDLAIGRRLYFVPAEGLTDRYEAMVPRRDFERIRGEWERNLSEQELGSRETEFFARIRDLRSRTLVSSWSRGPDESYGLWKIYLGGAAAGVGIRTTVSRIERALAAGGDPLARRIRVRWVNYTHSLGPGEPTWEELITRKAPFYQYEREVRCFVLVNDEPRKGVSGCEVGPSRYAGVMPTSPEPHTTSSGRHLPVDLEHLVKELYVSPFAPPWLQDVLVELLKGICPRMAKKVRSSAVRDS